jgi:hypothetical protein
VLPQKLLYETEEHGRHVKSETDTIRKFTAPTTHIPQKSSILAILVLRFLNVFVTFLFFKICRGEKSKNNVVDEVKSGCVTVMGEQKKSAKTVSNGSKSTVRAYTLISLLKYFAYFGIVNRQHECSVGRKTKIDVEHGDGKRVSCPIA